MYPRRSIGIIEPHRSSAELPPRYERHRPERPSDCDWSREHRTTDRRAATAPIAAHYQHCRKSVTAAHSEGDGGRDWRDHPNRPVSQHPAHQVSAARYPIHQRSIPAPTLENSSEDRKINTHRENDSPHSTQPAPLPRSCQRPPYRPVHILRRLLLAMSHGPAPAPYACRRTVEEQEVNRKILRRSCSCHVLQSKLSPLGHHRPPIRHRIFPQVFC